MKGPFLHWTLLQLYLQFIFFFLSFLLFSLQHPEAGFFLEDLIPFFGN